MKRSSAKAVAIEQTLCQRCGICCDGALFSGVQLQPGDSAPALRELGLSVRKQGKGWRLLQPCAALDGCHCRVYAERPTHCRQFRCRLLDQLRDGEVALEPALRVVRRARRLANQVQALLESLGETDARAPLKLRAKRILAALEHPSTSREDLVRLGELTQQLHQLHLLLSTRFYVEAPE